jgi:hypothetical protein
MYRVTRKQLITDGTAAEAKVVRFEDSRVVQTIENAVTLQHSIRNDELALGGQPYGPSKVIFESPTFYRSVTVTIEEIS